MSTSKVSRGRAASPPTVSPLLSKSSLKILQRVKDGETLVGTRTFPHPLNFKISGVNGKGTAAVALTIIDELVSAGCIDAAPANRRGSGEMPHDTVWCSVTVAGAQLLADGPPAPDATQLDWVEGA